MSHVHTQDQLSVLLTKPLSRKCTESLQAKIGLANESLILQGHIKKLRKVTQSKNQFQIDKKTTKFRIMPCKLIHLRKYIMSLDNF